MCHHRRWGLRARAASWGAQPCCATPRQGSPTGCAYPSWASGPAQGCGGHPCAGCCRGTAALRPQSSSEEESEDEDAKAKAKKAKAKATAAKAKASAKKKEESSSEEESEDEDAKAKAKKAKAKAAAAK